MTRRERPRTAGARSWVVAPALVLLTLGVTVVACGDDEPATPEARGRELADSLGCASCHGPDGQGGFGPPLAGLLGREVALADGTTVVADRAYLERSILAPGDQIVAGYTLPMPATSPSPQQLADLVAWIESLP